jgi:hypothetical protein
MRREKIAGSKSKDFVLPGGSDLGEKQEVNQVLLCIDSTISRGTLDQQVEGFSTKD